MVFVLPSINTHWVSDLFCCTILIKCLIFTAPMYIPVFVDLESDLHSGIELESTFPAHEKFTCECYYSKSIVGYFWLLNEPSFHCRACSFTYL